MNKTRGLDQQLLIKIKKNPHLYNVYQYMTNLRASQFNLLYLSILFMLKFDSKLCGE